MLREQKMSYYGNNDPGNPGPFNPDGSSNQAYFARQEEERRRSDAEEAEKRRRRDEADRFQREQAELQEQEARKNHQMEEQERSQAAARNAASNASSSSYTPSYSSSTYSGSSSRSERSGGGFFIVFALTMLAVCVITIYIPYQLGLAVGIERSELIGRWGWWGLLGLGLSGLLATALATVGIVAWFQRSKSVETFSKPGVAFVALLGFLGMVSGAKLAIAVVTYFVIISISVLLLTIGGVAIGKKLLFGGRDQQSASHDEEDWYSLLRTGWAWIAITVMTVLAIPLGVGISTSGGRVALTARGNPLIHDLNSVFRWPMALGDQFMANAFRDGHYWTAAGNLIAVAAIAVWWAMIAFVVVSLVSPRKGLSAGAAGLVSIYVMMAAILAMSM